MRRTTVIPLLILVGMTIILLAACRAAAPTPTPGLVPPTPTPVPAADPSRTPTVEMGEFYFKPDRLELPAGQTVELQLVNKGTVEHEFMVGREVEKPEGRAHGFHVDFFAGIDVTWTVEKGKVERDPMDGLEVVLEPGGKATLTFTVPADRTGEWEFACFVPGHYEAGQKGTLVVR